MGVDASSGDDSEGLLRKHLPSHASILSVAPHSFGRSVKAAVDSLGHPKPGRTEWLWLIHDDSVPELDALERLLTVVEATESVTIAGCKQLDLDSPRRLLDVGLGVNEYAERVTLIEVDEVDQGQYDARTDSFAVTSAGMLIRRDVFEQLGGFDPSLPGMGDDMDLCWRNRLMGNRVVVVPAAHMYHKAEVVRALAGPHETRRAEVFMRLKHAAGWKIPFLMLGAVLGGLYRFIDSLLAKDPGYAFGQLGATLRAVGSVVKLSRSRAAAAATRRVPRNSIARLLTEQSKVREHRKHLLESIDHAQVYGDGTGALTSQAPSGDSRDDFAAIAAPARTSAFISAVLATLGTLAVSLVGLRALIGAPAVSGGALLPLSTKAGEIFANATTWWQNLGAGIPGGADPFDFLLWLTALLGGGNANAAAVVLTLLAMPLAALSAWIGLGAVTRSRAARMVGGLFWGLAPVLQVSVASGRAGAALVHVAAPLLLMALLRTVGAAADFKTRAPWAREQNISRPGIGGVPSWTAAASASLLLAAVAAASPALGAALVVLVVLCAVPLGSRAKTLWWVPLPALVFQAPLFIAALGNPRALLADPGLPLAFAPAPLWAQALGFPVDFDPWAVPAGFGFISSGPWALVLAVAIGAPLLFFAALALFQGGKNAILPRSLWLVGVLLLAGGYAAGLVPTGVAGNSLVSPFHGPFISGFLLVMLFAAVKGIAALRREQEESAPAAVATQDGPTVRRSPKGTLVAASWLMALTLVAGGANWVLSQTPERADAQTSLGTTSALRSVAARTLPATATDRGLGHYEERTLVLAQGTDGAVSAALMNGPGTTADALSQVATAERLQGGLLAPQVRGDDAAEQLIESTVAMLVSDSALDPRAALASLGTGFVVLQESDETASALVARLDSVQGLVPVGKTDAGWLWRVEEQSGAADAENSTDFTSRVRVTTDGKTTALLPSRRAEVRNAAVEPGEANRMVVLSERADTGWRATLDGVPLKHATVGPDIVGLSGVDGASSLAWAQGFELGAAGGLLEVSYFSPYELPVAVARWTVLLLAVLLAIPIPRSRRFAARRLVEYRTRGNAESINELDRGLRETRAKENKS